MPIFLSIGYSACHWCHVMAHESFEDADIAAADERALRQHQGRPRGAARRRRDLHGRRAGHDRRGGWPMTVFLTPDGEPFYGGTYFPPTTAHGHARLPTGARGRVAKPGSDRRGEVAELGRADHRAARAIGAASGVAASRVSRRDPRRGRSNILPQSFDANWGGFGPAPKFPQPDGRVPAAHRRPHRRRRALEMVTRTLDGMARGGIYDHLGGGFHRYSRRRRWLVPHFEKMLYDNALLAPAYLDAWAVTGDDALPAGGRRDARLLMRELLLPAGGLASSQDADSDGVEARPSCGRHSRCARRSIPPTPRRRSRSTG